MEKYLYDILEELNVLLKQRPTEYEIVKFLKTNDFLLKRLNSTQHELYGVVTSKLCGKLSRLLVRIPISPKGLTQLRSGDEKNRIIFYKNKCVKQIEVENEQDILYAIYEIN